MTQQMIDLEISSPDAAPGALSMKPTESIAFSRGRQSLDRSVWYNGWLMTFLATGEDTHGQFALIEAVGRRGNVPPPHIHHREDEIFYVLEGEIVVSVDDRTIKVTPGTMVFLPRDVRHSFTIESEHVRMLQLLTPAGWKDGSRSLVCRRRPGRCRHQMNPGITTCKECSMSPRNMAWSLWGEWNLPGGGDAEQ